MSSDPSRLRPQGGFRAQLRVKIAVVSDLRSGSSRRIPQSRRFYRRGLSDRTAAARFDRQGPHFISLMMWLRMILHLIETQRLYGIDRRVLKHVYVRSPAP
jgi:hypothetical protein